MTDAGLLNGDCESAQRELTAYADNDGSTQRDYRIARDRGRIKMGRLQGLQDHPLLQGLQDHPTGPPYRTTLFMLLVNSNVIPNLKPNLNPN